MLQSWYAVAGGAAVVILLAAVAGAQTPVTLQAQLNAQYKVAKMAGAGAVVVEAGTLLAVQKTGIQGMPFRAIPKCPAKFEDNTLHPATGFFCTSMALQNYFQKGNKVYPLKIEVNPDKEKITFRVVSCDECNGIDPPTGLKGEVVFQFAKGYLEKAGAGEIEDTIGQVFVISGDQQQDQAGGQQDQGQQQEGQSIQQYLQTRQTYLVQLGQVLASGNFAGAQAIYNNIVSLAQTGPFGGNAFARNDRQQVFIMVGQALQSGDLSAQQSMIAAVFLLQQPVGQQAGPTLQQAGDRLQAANQQSPPEQRQEEPQIVQLGMTADQVQSTLGKPDKVFNLGAKQVYVYKDVKVTFISGKVNDVQ